MGTITATGLGKAYKQYPSPRSRLAEWLRPRSTPRHSLHWILQDIDLAIAPGETVGLIGINGAGKSTLLKILAGTTRPTTGSLHMGGRVAALLELGMGFHADFSGRQNVYMAGQLMGLSAADLQHLMPAIEAFAEIGDYIHQPVRVYSSGMQMRLAFSIATPSATPTSSTKASTASASSARKAPPSCSSPTTKTSSSPSATEPSCSTTAA